MKKFFAIVLLSLLALAGSLRAATWNDSYGMGKNANDWLISGAGVPLAVISSVQSNSLYYITSAKSDGAPRISQIWIKPDLTAGTLGFYIATNLLTLASNQPAGTNILWIAGTNAVLATNDLLVLQNVASDSYQLLVLGGGSTTATGLAYTNAAGYTGVKLWTTPTNTIVAGDRLWKLALVQSITPLAIQNFTNDLVAPWGNFWPLNTRATTLAFGGRLGIPSAIVMTYSNSAGLLLNGDYYVRQRR